MKSLIIGDPHFKYKKCIECSEYVQKVVEVAKKYKPTFIVILGDVLDTHEIVRVQPHNIVTDFFDKLSKIAHTFVLIGNHDLINNKQFLTDNHIFNPFKKWDNITIVDTPIYRTIGDKSFVFVPYVPPGRFVEALGKLTEEGETWELADCIFAHQEFMGCKMGAIESNIGDNWDEDYPLVISGHIHENQVLGKGKNIMYPGSSIQHSYSESSRKRIWMIMWDEESKNREVLNFVLPKIVKIDLNLKPKKLLKISVKDLIEKCTTGNNLSKEFEGIDLKIKLSGTSAEFKNFRKGPIYASLTKNANTNYFCTLSYELKNDVNDETYNNTVNECSMRKDNSFGNVLRDLINEKDEFTKKEYEFLFGTTTLPKCNVGLNFIDSDVSSEEHTLTSDEESSL